jgi:transposase
VARSTAGVETKLKVVPSVLSREMTAAEATRRHGISEMSIGKWKQQFLAGGKAGLEAKERRGPTGRERQLEAQLDDITRAPGEAHVELRLLKRMGVHPAPTRPRFGVRRHYLAGKALRSCGPLHAR